MSRVMALRHDLVSCPEKFPGIRQGNDKASPCRRSSVAWLHERRFHLNFRRFQSVAGADGKASLHNNRGLKLLFSDLCSCISYFSLAAPEWNNSVLLRFLLGAFLNLSSNLHEHIIHLTLLNDFLSHIRIIDTDNRLCKPLMLKRICIFSI